MTVLLDDAPAKTKPTPWQLYHAVEAVCRTCGILTWGMADDHESVRYRAWSHRDATGHDVELHWNDEDWPCALVAEINGDVNEDWWDG